jgi:hypothetical protein
MSATSVSLTWLRAVSTRKDGSASGLGGVDGDCSTVATGRLSDDELRSLQYVNDPHRGPMTEADGAAQLLDGLPGRVMSAEQRSNCRWPVPNGTDHCLFDPFLQRGSKGRKKVRGPSRGCWRLLPLHHFQSAPAHPPPLLKTVLCVAHAHSLPRSDRSGHIHLVLEPGRPPGASHWLRRPEDVSAFSWRVPADGDRVPALCHRGRRPAGRGDPLRPPSRAPCFGPRASSLRLFRPGRSPASSAQASRCCARAARFGTGGSTV